MRIVDLTASEAPHKEIKNTSYVSRRPSIRNDEASKSQPRDLVGQKNF